MANNSCGTPDNPCLCFGSYVPCLSSGGDTSTPTDTCPDENCLTLGNIIISPSETAGPCDSFTVSFSCFNYSGCEGGTVPVVTSIEGPATVTAINEFEIKGVIDCDAVGCETVVINIAAACGQLSDEGCITIPVRDKCQGVICGDCEECDTQTGLCEVSCPDLIADPAKPDFIVGNGPNPDISVN